MELSNRHLLERFATRADHGAFSELVKRYLPLVHAVALRVTANECLAQEVSQTVFSKLAHTPPCLPDSVPLEVWLHRVTRGQAIDLVRSEDRRRKREQTVAAEPIMQPDPAWEKISPILDDAIDLLPEQDRALILSRYFQKESHTRIGRLLGLSEDAARMRVNRALEKLRVLLEKRGITTTASVLAMALPAHGAPGVSATLCASVSATALAGTTVAGTVPLITLGIFTMTTKTAIISGCVLALAVAGVWTASSRGNGTAASRTASSAPDPASSAPTYGDGDRSPAASKSPRAAHQSTMRATSADAQAFEEGRLRRKKALIEKRQIRIDEHLEALKTRLELSEAQATAARACLDLPLPASGPPPDELVTAESEAKIAALLDPRQRESYAAFQEEQRENRIEVQANREMLGIQEKLTLTTDQKTRVYTAFAKQASLEDRNQDKDAMAAGRNEMRATLRDIFTPEQMAAYEAMPRLRPYKFLREGAEDVPENYDEMTLPEEGN